MICFHFSIFEVSETSVTLVIFYFAMLWFAFILVSLKYRKHRKFPYLHRKSVVICFHFSIFEVSETSVTLVIFYFAMLWFAFILVSLKYRKHRKFPYLHRKSVVICFHFSIFEVSETSTTLQTATQCWLWFAFILVSLKYRKHLKTRWVPSSSRCDLLSF